jgi:hypothetical protein
MFELQLDVQGWSEVQVRSPGPKSRSEVRCPMSPDELGGLKETKEIKIGLVPSSKA